MTTYNITSNLWPADQLGNHTITIKELDIDYRFVQCSSTKDRKRLEEIVYPLRKGASEYVLYTELEGEPAKELVYDNLEAALIGYNRIGGHKVESSSLDMPMSSVIASSASRNLKQLSFTYNTVTKNLVFSVKWKKDNETSCTELEDSIEKAVALYNSI